MSTPSTPPATPAGHPVAGLLQQVALAEATRLARAGNYSAAEELLADLVAANPPNLAALDLLARVRAQQGALLEAETLWRKLLQLDPHHPGASAGVQGLRRRARASTWRAPLLTLVTGLALLLGAVALFSRFDLRLGRRDADLRAQHDNVLQAVREFGSNQTRAEMELRKLGAFGPKIDEFSTAQRAEMSQLALLQEEARRLSLQQSNRLTELFTQSTQSSTQGEVRLRELLDQVRQAGGSNLVLAREVSNHVDSLQMLFQRELTAAKSDFVNRLALLQADGKGLFDRQQTEIRTLNEQVAGLRDALERERQLAAKIEQGRLATEQLQRDLRALTEARDRLVAQSAQLTNPPVFAGTPPGVRLRTEGNAVLLIFEDGLFDHDTHFKAGAVDRLDAVLRFLAQSPARLVFEVEGFADRDKGFFTLRDGVALGRQRATAVVNLIHSRPTWAQSRTLVAGGGANHPPFAPGKTELERARNRTVVIRITRSLG